MVLEEFPRRRSGKESFFDWRCLHSSSIGCWMCRGWNLHVVYWGHEICVSNSNCHIGFVSFLDEVHTETKELVGVERGRQQERSERTCSLRPLKILGNTLMNDF